MEPRGHYYSQSASDLPNANFRLEGGAFNAFNTDGGTNRQGLYRCFAGTYFLSTDPGCEGYTVGPLLGYTAVRQSSAAGNELYRCINSAGLHLETVSLPECADNAYAVEGGLGFVP